MCLSLLLSHGSRSVLVLLILGYYEGRRSLKCEAVTHWHAVRRDFLPQLCEEDGGKEVQPFCVSMMGTQMMFLSGSRSCSV